MYFSISRCHKVAETRTLSLRQSGERLWVSGGGGGSGGRGLDGVSGSAGQRGRGPGRGTLAELMPTVRRGGHMAAPSHAIIITTVSSSSPGRHHLVTNCGGAGRGGCGDGPGLPAGRTLGPPIRRVRRRQGGVIRAGLLPRITATTAADGREPPPPPAHRRPPGKGRASGRRHPAGGDGGARHEPLTQEAQRGTADLGRARPPRR